VPRFELKVIKNSLPYIQPYCIIARIVPVNYGHYIENKVIGQYKNQKIAEKAKENFEFLLMNEIIPPEFEDYMNWSKHKKNKEQYSPLDIFEKRLKNKDGDSPPKLPPSKKRKIIL